MKIGITGSSGHIGACLTDSLVRQQYNIRSLVHNHWNVQHQDHIEYITGDLMDKTSLEKLCDGRDIVYHLAATISIDNKNRDKVYETNVNGTKNIIEACISKKVKRLIHFSSIHALDPFPLDQELNESRLLTKNQSLVYEQSKARSDQMVRETIKSGFDAVILYPTAVIGPYDYRFSYLGQAIVKIYRNNLPVLIPGGYNWVDVRDVCDAAINAATRNVKGEKFLLSGHWYSLADLSNFIAEIFNVPTPRLVVPEVVARIGLPFISMMATIKGEHPLYTKPTLEILRTSHQNISSKKAIEKLNFSSRPIHDSLKDTIEFYKNAGILKQ